LVGLVLAVSKFGYRWTLDENLKNQLLVFCDEEGVVAELESIIFQIIRTSETEKITKHINEDIMPDVIKMSPKIKEKMQDVENEEDEDEINPHWQDFFENSGVADKLQELGDLQLSGSDIYVSTFAQMKNYPFFRSNENWFMPFFQENPHISRLFDKKQSLFTLILNNPALCNSDKYSFALTLLQMPENELSSIEGAVKEEQVQMKEIMKDRKNIEARSESKSAANQYIQDLYRFYTLFPHHQDFESPLTEITQIIEFDIFNKIFKNNENITNIAGYYFVYNHYNQALKLYLKIFSAEEPDLDICRKIAYCYQKTERFAEALQFYTIADSEEKDNTWTLKRMAFCYRKSGDYLLAADCYKRATEILPDDLKLLFRQAMCYIDNEDFEKAMPLLFKIDYLNPKYPKIKSVLLWCAFCGGKTEQAAEISQKIISEEPDIQDFVLSGNVALVQNNKQSALDFYRKALALTTDIKTFIELVENDIEKMQNLGVQLSDIELVIETLLMGKLPKLDV
jgi:tetratricopeptide (TPR) repeat protein